MRWYCKQPHQYLYPLLQENFSGMHFPAILLAHLHRGRLVEVQDLQTSQSKWRELDEIWEQKVKAKSSFLSIINKWNMRGECKMFKGKTGSKKSQFQKQPCKTVLFTYVYKSLRHFRMSFVNLMTNIFSNVMCSANTTKRINLPGKSNN